MGSSSKLSRRRYLKRWRPHNGYLEGKTRLGATDESHAYREAPEIYWRHLGRIARKLEPVLRNG